MIARRSNITGRLRVARGFGFVRCTAFFADFFWSRFAALFFCGGDPPIRMARLLTPASP
jgi:hypothetical protein